MNSMTVFSQITESWVNAPCSLSRIKRRSAIWMAAYLTGSLIVFSLFVWLLNENELAIKNALLAYFFPQSWISISEQLANFLFESQTKTVIGNAILGASLVISSMLMFPVKEKYSAEFEKDANYSNGPSQEFPLWLQAWEEVKLFLFYVTAQAVILWLGYYPYNWTNWLSIVLSYLFLFFAFGLDFISPTLQRHRTAYSLILKILLKKPLLTLSFGVIFSLPVILLSHYIFNLPQLSLIEVASILFLTNVLFLTLAVPAGTRVASRLMPIVSETPPPAKNTKIKIYSITIIILIASLFLHTRLIASLHHKSQILKANYSVDWSSIDYKFPSLSQLFNGNALSNLSFDMVIDNPTEFDIVIEESQIFVEKFDSLIATIDLSGFEVPAGQSRKIKLTLDSNSNLGQIEQLDQVLQGWRVDLQFELWPGIPFIVNIAE